MTTGQVWQVIFQIAVILLALLTVATMIVEAAITPGSITLDNFGVVVVAVFAASQARYRMLKDQID